MSFYFFVVFLFVTLSQKHTLFWSIYPALCFILHVEKQIFALCICLLAINKCGYFSPWKERLCILGWMKKSSPGQPQSSQPCWVLTFHSWFICLFDFEPQRACILLHGNEPLKWQKKKCLHIRSSPLKNSLWWKHVLNYFLDCLQSQCVTCKKQCLI